MVILLLKNIMPIQIFMFKLKELLNALYKKGPKTNTKMTH